MASGPIPPDDDVLGFWSWFERVAPRLEDDSQADHAALRELDARVATLGEFSWELGPGRRARCALTIGPGGEAQKLHATRRIVALAPLIAGWEFHWALQPKEWDLRFTLESTRGEPMQIDGRPWRYVLFRFPDGIYDIVLEQNNLENATDEDRYTAAVIAIDGLLGEGRRLLELHEIEPVFELSVGESAKATGLALLPTHLATLCSLRT